MLKIVRRFIIYFIIFVLFSFCLWVGYLLKGGSDAAIIVYHSIGESMQSLSPLNVSEETFQRQMAFLHRHRYHVISLLELAELLKEKKTIPPKTIVITFDDGYENNYTKAFPILRKYNFPATIFLIVNSLGQEKKFMTTFMVQAMLDSGLITIGAHGKNHLYLPDVKDEKVLEEEIDGAKTALEAIIGEPVVVFAYPIGGYSDIIKKYVQKAGYKAAVTTLPRCGFAHKDIYALKRIKMTEKSKNLFIFFIKTSGYYLRMKEMSKPH